MLALVGLGSASSYAPDDAAAILPLEPRQATGGGWRYLLSVEVGTPNQTLLLLLDTGSHQLLLRDAARGACGPGEPPSPPTCFNSTASTSIQERTDQENTFTYVVDVDVNLNGRYRTARDIVALGGIDPIDEAGSGAQSTTRPWVALLEAASQGGIGPVDRVEHFLADAAGVLGASHWPDGPWQSMLNIVSGGTDTFALDLNHGDESRLVLGGTYSAADISWSESQTAPDFQELLLYSPSVCGADLLGASSGWWLALIDSGSSCLGLPSNVFYGLFRWIDPSLRQCSFDLHDGETSEEAEGGASGGTAYLSARRCYLPRGADPAALPSLSFRLSQTGALLHLPLSELLLPTDADGTREFCIRSHTSSTVSSETRLIPILLGSQALHAFYAVFQMSPGAARVGLAQKHALNATGGTQRASGCAAQPTCIGQQQYVAATNECRPPNCAERYSRHYDTESGTCVLSTSFEAMALVLLIGFAVAELALQEWQTRLPRSTLQEDDGADDGYEQSREPQLPLPSGVQRRQPRTGPGDDGVQGRD